MSICNVAGEQNHLESFLEEDVVMFKRIWNWFKNLSRRKQVAAGLTTAAALMLIIALVPWGDIPKLFTGSEEKTPVLDLVPGKQYLVVTHVPEDDDDGVKYSGFRFKDDGTAFSVAIGTRPNDDGYTVWEMYLRGKRVPAEYRKRVEDAVIPCGKKEISFTLEKDGVKIRARTDHFIDLFDIEMYYASIFLTGAVRFYPHISSVDPDFQWMFRNGRPSHFTNPDRYTVKEDYVVGTDWSNGYPVKEGWKYNFFPELSGNTKAFEPIGPSHFKPPPWLPKIMGSSSKDIPVPKNIHEWRENAVDLIGEGKFDEAIGILSSLRDMDPSTDTVTINSVWYQKQEKAFELILQGKGDEAKNLLEKARAMGIGP